MGRKSLLKYLYLSVHMDMQVRLSIFKLRIQCDTQLQLKFYVDVKILKEMLALKKRMGIELERRLKILKRLCYREMSL